LNTCSIPKIYYQIVYARHSVDSAHLIDNSSIYVLPANTTSRYSKKPARSDWNGEGFIAVVVAGLLQESGAAISSTGRCAGTCAVCTRALRPCSTFLVLLRMMQDRSAAAAGGGFWATKIPPSCLPGGIFVFGCGPATTETDTRLLCRFSYRFRPTSSRVFFQSYQRVNSLAAAAWQLRRNS
jgi:hypothetical protein